MVKKDTDRSSAGFHEPSSNLALMADVADKPRPLEEHSGASADPRSPQRSPVVESNSLDTPKNSRVADEITRPGKRQRLEGPELMTAAAAMAEERTRSSKSPVPPSNQTSPNPQVEALSALLGVSQQPTSKADDPATGTSTANPTTTLSRPMAVVAENLHKTLAETSSTAGENAAQTSPVSVSSLGMSEGVPVTSGIGGATVGSPLPMDGTARSVDAGTDSASPEDDHKAFSYPAPLLQPHGTDSARRGMSLPHSGIRQGTRSPSSKKHKCPFCSTEFTRHHNLKSHLLTHSQEKPYVCSTCTSRFRRLHDLKRHTKLHTGERPHVCPKCNRKFARGDALARHNKGPGGCAGRRSSMGSFGGDDDDGADDMEGVVYNEPEAMDDEEHPAGNTPQIRRHAPSGDDLVDEPQPSYRMPSTYPPIQGPPHSLNSGSIQSVRPGFAPPAAPAHSHAGPGPYTSSASTSSLRPGPGGGTFAQNPVTESPKPLSPAQRMNTGPGPFDGAIGRDRSSSNPKYSHQPSYPPRAPSNSNSLPIPPHGPQLPLPHGLNPPDPRFTLSSQGPTHPPTGPSGPPTHMSSGPLSSHSNSSSHGQSGHGSGEGPKSAFPTNEERLWAIVRSMEQQMNSMLETVNALKDEVSSLRSIVTQQARS